MSEQEQQRAQTLGNLIQRARLHADRHRKAVCLGGGAVAMAVRLVRGRNTDIAGEGAGALLAHGGILRLPAETADHRRIWVRAACQRHPAGDAVTVAVVGIGMGGNVGGVDGLDQPHSYHCLGRYWQLE